ncbi:MAG: hypothetical protein KC547_03715 [Anaerolineae bacterium]|nr:hypothetical protein [Anaerolineae bacterium]
MNDEIKTAECFCNPPTGSPQPKHCPLCGAKGRLVDSTTMKSMLSVSLRRVRDVTYRFCATADCPVVYFSEDSTQTFLTTDVRERVYQKEPEADDVLICYCFQHTPGEIRQEFAASGETAVVDDIQTGIQAGQCACDWRNPQGNCCLGNVQQFIKQLRSKYPTHSA